MGTIEYKGITITHFLHASFKITGQNTTIYIDPFQISSEPHDADIVICTHDHYDHCSPDDVKKVAKKDTVIIASTNCMAKVKQLGLEYKLLNPGDKIEVRNVAIEAVPAYNIGKRFHPKEYRGIGVVVRIGGVAIYHAGDTDLIPEMSNLRGKVQVALLPVSGTYVMDWNEAVKAAETIMPEIAIPMHYGAIVGNKNDAENFAKKLAGKVRVEII
jgi:L-ascorbate metabolism protein UlaG (beta-lactamase superfamily)